MANPDGSSSSSLPFEKLSKFKNCFEKIAMADVPTLERKEAVKHGTIPIKRLHELMTAVGVKVSAADAELVANEIVRERGHSMELKEPWLCQAELGVERVSFEDFCWGMTDPRFSVCLEVEETLTNFRRTAISDYTTKMTSQDPAVREAAMQDPPALVVGDKQAVRSLAMRLHDLKVPEDVRVDLAKGISVVAEKPREASGQGGKVKKEGGKQQRIYDNKSIAAFSHSLRLSAVEPIWLDTRTFDNKEPPDAPIENTEDLVAVAKSITGAKFVTKQPSDDRPEEAKFLIPFHKPCNEPSATVRTACVLGFRNVADTLNEITLKMLLNTLLYDPGWTVRAAALDVLRAWADDIRKEGPTMRWGTFDRWHPERWFPWRDARDSLANFWVVMSQVRNDPAWQVRKRAIMTMAQTCRMGHLEVMEIVAAALEDLSSATRRAAKKTLTMALFGRGSYVSERKHKIWQYVQEGMTRWDASIRAQDEVSKRKGGIDSDLVVIDVLIQRCFMEGWATRKAACVALGDVLQSAQSNGDHRAMQALIDVVRNDADETVQRAAVQAMSKASLAGEEKTLETLRQAAQKHERPQVRKAAVESLERLTVKGEPETIKSLSECLKDEYAEVRESAVRALERAADEGEEDTLKAVEGVMKDESWFVRRAATRSMTMLEPEGEAQTSVAAKVFGKEDKAWYREVAPYLTKPLFYPV